MITLGLPSDYADAGSVQTARFQRPADAYNRASVLAAKDPSVSAVGGQCPPGTTQMGLVCVKAPAPQPPVAPPPTCPAGMYWTGGECASVSPPPPLPGPTPPATPFFDVGQNPAPAGTQVVSVPSPIPPGYFVFHGRTYPKWWAVAGMLVLGLGVGYAIRHR